MDWSNERHVRLFTRDTLSWRLLPWQGKALWPLILRKVDRAGLLPLDGHGVAGLAVIVELPLEVVEPGYAALLKAGYFVMAGDALFAPNFLEAQEAPLSDAQRQRDSREKRAAAAAAAAAKERVTNRDATWETVTQRDAVSRNVTDCHAGESPRTECHSDPARPARPDQDPPLPPSAGAPGAAGDPLEQPVKRASSRPTERGKRSRASPDDVAAVRAAVRELGGPDYDDDAAWTQLRKRLREGLFVDDALEYVRWAAGQRWERDEVNLDPAVLFGKARCASGVAKARAAKGRLRIVGGLPLEPEPAPTGDVPLAGAHEERQCSWCPAVVLHRWNGYGWYPAAHERCSSPHATSERAQDIARFAEFVAAEGMRAGAAP